MYIVVASEPLTQCKKYQKNILQFLSSLDITPKSPDPYIQAFIHRSLVNERPDIAPEHNERLEFLGDAVLELVITDALYQEFPDMPEGDMTDLRSALVRGRNLAEVAKKIHLEDYLLLGKGEEKSGGRENDYLLANTMEALIGAIYTDVWYEAAEKFIMQYIYSTLPYIMKHGLTKDYKTLLQEFTQATYDTTPSYEVLSESGPDHNKEFRVGVYLWDKQVGKGEGTSKKKAQEDAAQNAYTTLTN